VPNYNKNALLHTVFYQASPIYLFLFMYFSAEPDIIKWASKYGWGKDIIMRWSLTQNATITEQLKAGVRYFDMRPGYLSEPDDFFFTHGIYGDKIAKMLEEMKSFLEANPKEVLIVDFNHFYSFTDSLHERFVNDVVLKNFKDKTFNHGSSYEINMSLKDFWDKEKQVIIRYCNTKSTNENKELWPSQIIDSPWFNTDSITKLIPDLDSRLDTLKNDTMNVFQAILTPQNATIAFHFTSSLQKHLAVPGNVHIKTWLETVLSQRKKGVNVVICDFELLSQLVPSILNLNNLMKDGADKIHSK